ncbi:pumilio homolog 23 isoform X2 [Andrographis paniculata]|uniref:pumilio homolog 23 isoform X2 n=1 Tax=Andrographis paniculata TaxID=175694 RepID=UPI0021E98E6E|nr:pumilio homolog 23 isoform X2 [Andrographis paniculata]
MIEEEEPLPGQPTACPPSTAHRLFQTLRRSLIAESFLTGEEKSSHIQAMKVRKMGRKGSKKDAHFHGGVSTETQSAGVPGTAKISRKSVKENTASASQASFIRKQVDPDTAKYFTEISNVLEGSEVDLEERSVICGNALEEARGKEVELATDYIISHTMQTLLEGCSLDNLCAFLRSCGNNLAYICMDRSGSHVVETALKSLARHLEDDDNHSLIEETLSTLIQAILVNPIDMICNCYGSHVIRGLLCLCKGVPIDSPEFHSLQSSTVLAERLNFQSSQLDGNKSQQTQPFPNQLKYLISEMVNPSRVDIGVLQVNQFSSLVLQTALKLLAGSEQDLFHTIPILLSCDVDNGVEGNLIEAKKAKKILRLVEENAYSHLMEVIVAVAPDSLYSEIFTKVFKSSLFRLSAHPCGNFALQALISHARNKEHITMMLEELDSKFKDMLEMGRSGVVAALVAASQRLQINESKCCQALADAVCSTNEPSACIVPRILFLDNYLYCSDKANWKWPSGVKMHVLGSLLLQTVFRFPSEFIQSYITSITSLEDNQVLEASKDPAGARVIEAFVTSNASTKRKRKLIIKLQGHFGELSVLPSGSFTVEKCFNASNMSMRETIVSELLPFQTELSKTKQGPYLLKKLDAEGFAKRPDQWRSRQTTRESAYKEFYEAFGPRDTQSSRSGNFLSSTHSKSQAEGLKGMRKEIYDGFSSSFSHKSGAPFLAHQGSAKRKKAENKQVPGGSGLPKDDDTFIKGKSKKQKVKTSGGIAENSHGTEDLHGEGLSIKNKRKRRRDG